MPVQRIVLSWTTIWGIDTTGSFIPVTGWIPTAGIQKVRCTIEMHGRNGNLSSAVAYEVTDDPQSPPGGTSGTAIGSAVSSDGYSSQTSFTDITTDTNAKQFIRFGFVGKLTTGSTLATGRITAVLEIVTV